MLSIYLTMFVSKAHWAIDGGGLPVDVLTPGKWNSADGWNPPSVHWSDPDVALTDFTDFSGYPDFSIRDNEHVVSIFEKTTTLLPLAGDADGRAVAAFKAQERLVDPSRTVGENLDESGFLTQGSAVTRWAFHEDLLVPNTVVYIAGLGTATVELESPGVTRQQSLGLRAYAKNNDLAGVLFKRIWCSDEPVEYHRGWFYRAIKDRTLWD